MSADRIAARALELAAVLAGDPDGRGLVDAISRVGELRRLVDGLGVDLAGRIEVLSSSDREKPLAREFAEKSACMLVQAYVGLDVSEAFAWCRVGAALHPRTTLYGEVLPQQHPAMAAALADGRLRVAGADRVLGILEEVAPYASADQLVEVEQFLVGNAPDLTDRQFARLCRSVPSRFVPDDAHEREEY